MLLIIMTHVITVGTTVVVVIIMTHVTNYYSNNMSHDYHNSPQSPHTMKNMSIGFEIRNPPQRVFFEHTHNATPCDPALRGP